jgi:hypothetical protein
MSNDKTDISKNSAHSHQTGLAHVLIDQTINHASADAQSTINGMI